MVKLKNYNGVVKHFVLLLTFAAIISCAEKKYAVTKIEGKEIGITDKNSEVADIENFIKPYRDKIDADLNTVLASAPENIDKSGEWQTPMGNFLADITYEKSNKVFQIREKKSIDICLLNHGGIRSVISKGNITARTAYEIMPFENSAIIIGLKGAQILEIVNYIISEKKPHPLKGLTFTIDKDTQPKNILVNGIPLDNNKIYYVVTSDYLSSGGDNMLFFKKGVEKYDLDYKLRNIIIDYFKENKTITSSKDIRITKE
ncbi:5'-nucleotidase [Flavobacterium paronense]|uniref:5'-nucleotidase C-terminal domain-containing protein n=1 Tax=Flavobacterium paronense TaxID=1392775 RepID=A0ABV5GHM5_9FLAO|nr:5'-nucleotidase [Flavobacterium paronense]MDN3675893.1 5'-nucleotidase [Flavobacterium paronense]MDN3677167.1 5'-nucleotidase [Flavobacterium paronense]